MSAGNTGAMLVGAMFTIKAIPGVLRPTIGATMPKSDGSTGILVDVGLNADCKPEQLNQFAILGSLYASIMLGVNNPTVGLLNIGEEEGKGNALAQATYPLLQQNKQIHFIGNIEGRDILTPKANVTVCDGFTGNIALKLAESLHTIASERGHGDDAYFKRLHFENYGGLPVLGVAKPVIISHGISTATAFHNSIGLAVQMLETSFCDKIAQNFST
jgi:glycerol-3-phosphate acyltransferase PlsX